MHLRNQAGQTLMSTMVAIALLAILVLASMNIMGFISRAIYVNRVQDNTVALDIDLANLLVVPQLCTCNMRANNIVVDTNNLNAVQTINQLSFYTDPPERIGQPSCNNGQTVMQAGQRHGPSGLVLGEITIGPFHPLGNRATSENFIATVRVKNHELTGDANQDIHKAKNRDAEMKVVLSTKPAGGTRHEVDFCGIGQGNSPTAPVAAYGRNYYRFVQYSLNFSCMNIIPNEHPNQVEPYVMTRNQYFWPAEEGNLFTEYESTRVADTPMAPIAFSAFAGTATCFEEVGVGDSARLILPARNMALCPTVKNAFLNQALNIIDIGFSLVDNCAGRFL